MRQEKACAGFNKISAILEHSCGLLLQVDDQPSVATISAHRPNMGVFAQTPENLQ